MPAGVPAPAWGWPAPRTRTAPAPPATPAPTSLDAAQQLKRQQRRVKNRASVERCRTKQRARLAGLEQERADLSSENGRLRKAIAAVEAMGVVAPLRLGPVDGGGSTAGGLGSGGMTTSGGLGAATTSAR